ncbi:BZ3500_MvSof-1268-A1-R1_Chr1-3g01668 [Microbotryum saponariae]|uniref:Peptidyl-prolyl cis-trans isomerase n=1 Tax=Microbotryum saponariae TaxID=289078 RepID=A0A2X0KEF4_9BASI|nr:BZ3500_MvSof-1268-A1-R1_Chr1-3g01668 [Microbotryum saponariae]SCZ94279.1 BZ3501_MvSof-1269-A2-R1_Chr1-3g01269 [Microbotryum saponariae]
MLSVIKADTAGSRRLLAPTRQWEIRFSATRKRPYFYCPTTSESVWEAPPALTPEKISTLPGAHHLAYEPPPPAGAASPSTNASASASAAPTSATAAHAPTAAAAPAAAPATQQAAAAASKQQAPVDPNAAPIKVRASHLLIKSEKSRRPSSWRQLHITRTVGQAREILQTHQQNLQAAEDLPKQFARVAKAESDCSSAREGGDLGFFGRQQMQKPFEEAAFALKVGEMSPISECLNTLGVEIRYPDKVPRHFQFKPTQVCILSFERLEHGNAIDDRDIRAAP